MLIPILGSSNQKFINKQDHEQSNISLPSNSKIKNPIFNQKIFSHSTQKNKIQLKLPKNFPRNFKQQQQISKRASDILRSGKFMYVNMNKDKSIDFIRAITPSYRYKKIKLHQGNSLDFGFDPNKLTTQERESIDYVNSQIKQKQQDDNVILSLKSKYRLQKEQKSKPLQKQKKKKKFKGETRSDFFTKLHSNELGDRIFRQKIHDSQIDKYVRKLNHVISKQKNDIKFRQTSYFEKKYQKNNKLEYHENSIIKKWIKTHQKQQQKTKIQSNDITKLDKYNIPFDQYLKKKSDKQIERRAIIRYGHSNQTKVKQYQSEIINKINVRPSFKQNILNIFDSINKESKKVQI